MLIKSRDVAVLVGLLGSALWAPSSIAQVCADPDGDGWGWDGSQSCRVSVQPAAVVDTNCADPDGDGFGWDGTATCLTGQNSQPEATETPMSGQCLDEDGDGWGWNGVASCRVGADNTSVVNPMPVVTPTPAPPVSTLPPANNGAFNSQRDLVAIHFDHAPDRDDGHAAVAALMVTRKLGLNVQVVAGTYGEYSRSRYDAESEPLMYTVWGSEWLNAHSNWQGSVNDAVNRWSSVLSAGGSVWVAEGGPSDFTADVVTRINQLHSELNTRNRIHVIQHSDWNEDHALASKLAYTKANTRYVRVDDGNDPNATADFRIENNRSGPFVSRAQSSRYSAEWTAAFRYLSPSEKLDFSDTVELLHIVGIGKSTIADVDQFGDYFF